MSKPQRIETITTIYTHEIAKEIRSIGARYEFDREAFLEWEEKPILYAVGNAVVDSSCCGFWGCRYCLVVGYVTRFKFASDEAGNPLSEVTPITDIAVKHELTNVLKEKEGASQVIFL